MATTYRFDASDWAAAGFIWHLKVSLKPAVAQHEKSYSLCERFGVSSETIEAKRTEAGRQWRPLPWQD